jgi:hypothetical protein
VRLGRKARDELASAGPTELDTAAQIVENQIARGVVHSRTLVSLHDENDRACFERALAVFQASNGSIVKWETVPGKASLLQTEGERRRLPWNRRPAVRLFLEWNRKEFSSEVRELVDTQVDLVRRAEQRVSRSDRIEFVSDLSTLIWSTIDRESPSDGTAPSSMSDTEARIRTIEGQVDRAAERSSQLNYLAGMAWVALPLVGLVLGVGLVLDSVGPPKYELRTFDGTVIAGGLGAVVSVLERMAHGRIWLTPELGLRWARILGTIRPVLGVVFAAVAYAAFTGDLIGVTLPGGNGNFWAMAIVGFLAGFSERFAKEMLVVTQRGVGVSAEAEAEAEANDDGR